MMKNIFTLCLMLALWLPAVAADPDAQTWTSEQIRAEFQVLYEQLQASHYDIYAHRPRDEYDALFTEMLAAFDRKMGLDEIKQEFQRFVAYGNVAHANIEPPIAAFSAFREAGGKTFPAYLRVMGETAYVNDVRDGTGLSVGDQVTAIDGLPTLDWLQRLRSHISADSPYLGHTILENMMPLVVWQEFGEQDVFQVEIIRGEEEPRTLQVAALGLASDDVDSDAEDDGQPARFSLDWNERQAHMLTDRIAYLRPGPFYDNRPEANHPWDATAFHAFVDDAFASFIDADAGSLLIDLRNNPGGSNDFSDHLIAWFATRPFRFSDKFEIKVSEAAIASNRERLDAQEAGADTLSAKLAAAYGESAPGGEIDFPIELVAPREGQRFAKPVYLLVDRHSYSNAVSMAAIGQDYGFATVLGEPTADLANTYGGMEHFTLPSTGIRVGFPKARILRPSRDMDADTVVPDVLIESPLAPIQDIVLQRAVAAISAMDPE